MELLTITKNHPDFEGIKWILKAKTKNKSEVRNYLVHAYINEGHFIMTDAARLHKYKLIGDFEKGFYKVNKNNKSIVELIFESSVDINYPDYNDLFKEQPEKNRIDITDNLYVTLKAIYQRLEKDQTINHFYIVDVINPKDENGYGELFECYYKDSGLILFTNEGKEKEAVVMIRRI